MSGAETLTAEEVNKMRHAIGWPKNYRNHFVTDPEGPDGLIWEGLVARGLATASKRCDWMSDMVVYRVSDAGSALLARNAANGGADDAS